jgi:hypothetical protein
VTILRCNSPMKMARNITKQVKKGETMRVKKRTFSKAKFMHFTSYLNRAEVSRGLGMNRMYITDIRHGKTKYTKEIGWKLRRFLGV